MAASRDTTASPLPWLHRGLLAGGLLAALPLTGCPFGPALPVEERDPNLPPMISEEFLAPRAKEVVIPRDEGFAWQFSVDPILDINENELLTVYWFSTGPSLQEEKKLPEPAGSALYRGIFNTYEGSTYSLDPCQPEWTLADRLPLTVYVTDRNAEFVGQPRVISEEGFADSYTWFIRFEGECIDR